MVDVDFYLNYLHKRDREPIFDIIKWRYIYAKNLNNYNVYENKLLLEVKTNNRNKIFIEIFFIGKKSVLIRAYPKYPGEFIKKPYIEKIYLEDVRPEMRLEENRIYFSSGEITIVVDRSPFKISIKDKYGKTFFDEYVEGENRLFPVYPLGYKIVNGEKRFFESIALKPSEAIYGLGERYGSLNKRGQSFLLWNCDTTLTSSDRSYKNIPFYLSTSGYGLLVLTGSKMVFEVGSEYSYNSLSFMAWQDYIEYIVFYGPLFKDILEQYNEIIGKPDLPPLWSFGLWMSRCMYRNREQVVNVARKLREYGIPCDVINIDPLWIKDKKYCIFEWNYKDFPNPREIFSLLNEMGFKVCLWEQPYVPKNTEMYMEGVKNNFFIKDREGKIIHISDFVRNEVALIDFTNPDAREWYKEKHKKIMSLGAKIFKTDMGDAVPENSVFYNGLNGISMHNLYAYYYQLTVYEAIKEFYGEAVVWGRPGCIGIQKIPLQWSGDSHSTFRDMASVLRSGLSYSLSGALFWSHDIGGFQGKKPSPILYIRWSQWGLLSSHSRCHGTSPREPWEYGEEALKIFIKFDKLRYSLLPYIYSCAYEAILKGIPIVRPLILEFQDDKNTWNIDLEYMFGPNMLIVPIFSENGEVEYYLPKGKWINWWSKKIVDGGEWFKEKYSLDKIPIYIRENSIIPYTDPMSYVGERNYDKIILEIYVFNKAEFKYFFDGEEVNINVVVNNGMDISLTPSTKTWILKIYFIKTFRRIETINCVLKNAEHNDGILAVTIDKIYGRCSIHIK